MGQETDEEPVYLQLNKLLARNQLRAFVDSHPAFSWSPLEGTKGMLITWDPEAPPPAPSSASADQALLSLPAPAPSSAAASCAVPRSGNGGICSVCGWTYPKDYCPMCSAPERLMDGEVSKDKPAPGSASAEKPAPASTRNKMNPAPSSASAAPVAFKPPPHKMTPPLFLDELK